MTVLLCISVGVNIGLFGLVIGLVRVALSESNRADTATAWVPKELRHNLKKSILSRKPA